jgi:hypothetical protein
MIALAHMYFSTMDGSLSISKPTDATDPDGHPTTYALIGRNLGERYACRFGCSYHKLIEIL